MLRTYKIDHIDDITIYFTDEDGVYKRATVKIEIPEWFKSVGSISITEKSALREIGGITVKEELGVLFELNASCDRVSLNTEELYKSGGVNV